MLDVSLDLICDLLWLNSGLQKFTRRSAQGGLQVWWGVQNMNLYLEL